MKKEMEDEFEFQNEPETFEQEAIIDDLLDSCPHSEGFYLKLFKWDTAENMYVLKEDIIDYESWKDLELEVKNFVTLRTKQKGAKSWGSGKYKLMIFKKGKRGFVKRPETFLIDAGEPDAPQNETNIVTNKLSEFGDFMGQMQKVMPKIELPPQQPPVDARMIADTFKSGVDLAKSMIPPATSNLPQQQPDVMNMMLTMLKVLKETERPKEDAFEMLLKLKQLGMINMPNDNSSVNNNDPINQVSKISELMQVMAPLMGNSPIEQPSAWMKLVEIVAPAIPQIIANVTQAVQSVTDLSKAKLSASLGVSLPPSASSPIGIAGTPISPTMQQTIQNPQNEVKSMNPIVKQIYQAVKTKNIEFYPQMKSLIESWVNPYVIQELVNGRADLDGFLSQAGVMLGEAWFTTDETKTYFEGFISWCKEEHIKNIVVVKCVQCGDYFDVNKADYKHGEKCDCGGLLEAISNNGVTADSGVAV